MKKPEQYFCDICGENFDPSAKLTEENSGCAGIEMTAITSCEWTEGHSIKPRAVVVKIDICRDCYLKSIGITCGFRGQNPKLRYSGGA